MRKWDRKSTSSLAARVRELKGETPTTRGSSRVDAAPVAQVQNSRWYRKDDMTDPLEGTTCTMTRNRGALPLARWRKGAVGSIGLCGFNGLARLMHKNIWL